MQLSGLTASLAEQERVLRSFVAAPRHLWQWQQLFQCVDEQGTSSPFALSHAALVLSIVCVLTGILSAASAALDSFGSGDRPALEARRAWNPKFEWLRFVSAVYGGCFFSFLSLVTAVFVAVGFAHCGHLGLMWVSIVLKAVAQAVIAADWAFEPTAESEGWPSTGEPRPRVEVAQRFFLSLVQARVIRETAECRRLGQVTNSFARLKFLEAAADSGPHAIFAVFVIYCFDQHHNVWLTISTCSSILCVAWGVAGWFAFSLDPDQRPRDTSMGNEADLRREGTEEEEECTPKVCVQWHHQCLWTSYFSADFGLRLLSAGLFLSAAVSQVELLVSIMIVICLYSAAVAGPLMIEDWQVEVRDRKWAMAMAVRFVDGFFLTCIVFALPAEVSVNPGACSTLWSRTPSGLSQEVRISIVRLVAPLRALDFLVLGTLAMVHNFDQTQFLALVSMFLVSQVLLVAIIILQKDMTLQHEEVGSSKDSMAEKS